MPSIDVAVPCYQYGRFLRGCVTSVLSQGMDDVRVLIIDNASTDDSLTVARALAAEDSRVTVIAHPSNLGLHASFNEGIDWASADYFTILFADDLLAPGSFARAMTVMEQHSEVVLTFGRELVITADDPHPVLDQLQQDPQWKILPGQMLLEQLCRTGRPDDGVLIIGNSTALVRTSVQKQAGHYRTELPHTSDLEMWMRILRFGAAAQTDAVQGIRRVHPESRSSSSIHNVHMWNLLYEAAFESFFANEGAVLPNSSRLRRVARRALSERAYWGALATLLRGDRRLSLDLLTFAITRCPTTMVLPPVGYLLRREDTLSHFAGLVSGAVGRLVGRSEAAGPPG